MPDTLTYEELSKPDTASFEELSDAQGIRTNTGQLGATGLRSDASQTDRRRNLEQAAPQQPQSLAQGKEEAPQKTLGPGWSESLSIDRGEPATALIAEAEPFQWQFHHPTIGRGVQTKWAKPGESEQSLIGISPEDIPSGGGTTMPGVTIPISAVGKAAAGVAQYMTSPKGLTEIGLAQTPAAPAVFAKWAYDVLKGGYQAVGDAVDIVKVMIRDAVSREYIKHNQLGIAPTASDTEKQEAYQRLAEDAVNASLAVIAGPALAHGAISKIPRTATTEPKPSVTGRALEMPEGAKAPQPERGATIEPEEPAPTIPALALEKLQRKVRKVLGKPAESGRADAAAGKTLDDNPYVEDTSEASAWEAGWRSVKEPKPAEGAPVPPVETPAPEGAPGKEVEAVPIVTPDFVQSFRIQSPGEPFGIQGVYETTFIISPNTIPGQKPYRITMVDSQGTPGSHIDISKEDAQRVAYGKPEISWLSTLKGSDGHSILTPEETGRSKLIAWTSPMESKISLSQPQTTSPPVSPAQTPTSTPAPAPVAKGEVAETSPPPISELETKTEEAKAISARQQPTLPGAETPLEKMRREKAEAEEKGLGPIQRHYRDLKKEHPGEIVLTLLGDFYEAFWDDAKTLAAVTKTSLTKRQGVPMAGVPFHAAESSIAKLKAAGHKVFVDEPSATKPGPATGEGPGIVGAAAAPKPQGIAASVRGRWTSATEGPVTGESGFISLAPLKELWDKAAPAVKASIDFVRGVAKEQMTLAKTSDYRRDILHWSAKLQRSFSEAAAAQREIRAVTKDPSKLDGITNYMQANGDRAILQDRLAKTISWRDPVTGKPHPQAKQLIAGYEAALKLTPEEIAVATDARNAYDTLAGRGHTYDVLHSFKENYVTQIWNLRKGPTGGFGMFGGARTLRDKFRFSKASTFPTYFDGEQAGFVPKTKDISKILPTYLHEMNSVIAARQLVEQMSKGKASDGRPLIAARGGATAIEPEAGGRVTLVMPDMRKSGRSADPALNDRSDYVEMPNQPALHGWRMVEGYGTDSPVYLKSDLVVHPEAAKYLKNVLGKSAISEWYRSGGSMSAAIPKKLVHALDLAQSETKRTMLGVLTPFHQVQEATHAIGHRVNPFFNNPKIDLVNDAEQMDAAKHGLMLLPDRASSQQFMEGFQQSQIVSRTPWLGPIADQYSHYLFHQYIPAIKFKTYQAILERNQAVFAKDLSAGKVKPEDVKILSAEQANAAYGHLNYADLGRNPTILHFMRLGMLAPDFLEARMRFAGQAVKGLAGGKIGREQVIALGILAVAQATLAYTTAKLTGGQWDAKDPFSFHVGNRKFTMRSVPEDALRAAFTDRRAFWTARLNPITARGPIQYAEGRDWRGQKVTGTETTKELLRQPIPLVLRPLFGNANSPLSGWEQIASAVGLKVSRYSAQSEVRKLAHEWMAKSQDPKILAAEQRYEKETFPDSDYKPLREALINNDTKTANAAYRKLLETRNPSQVSRAMTQARPFSGSAARESKFKASLSEEEKTLYEQAVRERNELRTKFYLMVRRGNRTLSPK